MSNQTLALLILLFPAAGALLLAGRGWRLPRIFTVLVGPGVVWASFVCVLALFAGKAAGDFTYWTWIKSGTFEVPFNLLIDNLSIFMCLVITGVGGLIVSYAVGYMEHEDDPSYARFFCYMDVFIFSMLLLVLAGNFVFLITGWALVGLSSYLLIGFWYQRHSAVVAARKAFVMNVIGDVGMILGTFIIFMDLHSVRFADVFRDLRPSQPCQFGQLCASNSTVHFVSDSPSLELAAFLLLVGAIAKSAQIPLHTWLPDAMHDEQDMRKYGGLWNQMRPTSIAFLVGSLSLVGVFPFVGFFSKEQILGAAFSKPDDTVVHFLWFIGFVTALITGFYTGRMWWLSFWGKPSPQRPVEHPHEAPAVMFVPVAILAVLATVGGLLQTKALGFGTDEVSNFLTSAVGSERWEGGGAEIALTLLTMLLAAALFVWAMRMRPWTVYAPWAQRLLERKYYFDEIYDAVFVRPLDWVAGFLQRDVERPVIDAAVVDTGALARWSAGELSLTQSGYFRNYVLVFVVGVVSIAGVLLLVRALT